MNTKAIALAHFMLIWSWQSFVLLTVAWAGVKLDRSRSPAMRYNIWLAGLAACALLPLWMAAFSVLPAPLPPSGPIRFMMQFTAPSTVAPQRDLPVLDGDIAQPSQPRPSALLNASLPWTLGAIAWAVGCLYCLGRLFLSYWQSRRLRKLAQVGSSLTHLQVRLGYSSEVSGPMLVGVRHPMILLPAAIESWTTEEQRAAIIKHELAHFERHDPVVNLFQGVFGAVFFFHPMARYVLRQLNLERELACDDRVLAAGTDAPVYAKAILDAAERGVLRRERVLSALHSSRWILERRIGMILRRDARPHSRHVWGVARLTVMAVLLVAVSGLLAFRIPEAPVEESFSQFPTDLGPSSFAPSYDLHIVATPASEQSNNSSSGPGFWSNHGVGLRDVLAQIYGVEPSRIDLPASMDGSKRYNLGLVLPQRESEETIHRLVQRGIETELQVRMALETRAMKVYVLTALDSVAAHALPVKSSSFSHSSFQDTATTLSGMNEVGFVQAREVRLRALASGVPVKARAINTLSTTGTITEFSRMLAGVLDRPLVDETHLQGTYGFKLTVNSQNSGGTAAQALKDQLGLVLTPDERKIPILAVRIVDPLSAAPLTEVGALGQVELAQQRVGLPAAPPSQVRLEDVRVTGLDADGVRLTSPSSPDFDARVQIAAHGWGPIMKPAKPYTVLVSNATSHKVVAYALEWTLIGSNGRSQTHAVQAKDPDSIAGDFNSGTSRAVAILPGKERLASSDFELSGEYKSMFDEGMGQWVQQMLRNYESVRKIEVRLVTVIFDDGVMIGQDQYSLGSEFAKNLKAKQDAYRAIAERIDKGASVDESFRAIRSTIPQEPTVEDLEAMMAFSEAEELRKKFGDARIREVLRQAILKEPFVIRQKP